VGALSIVKTEQGIDALVDRHDPGALRRSREAAQHRTVEFGSPTDAPGVRSMWARMCAPDAALIEARGQQMARSVCEDDPRTLAERRADARVALAAGAELACACGTDGCTVTETETPPKNAVVYVVAGPPPSRPRKTPALRRPQRTRPGLRRPTRSAPRRQPSSSAAASCPHHCWRRRCNAPPSARGDPPRERTRRTALHPVPQAGPVHPVPGPDVSLPGL
jgi:Domain of unknown function (DUF222)